MAAEDAHGGALFLGGLPFALGDDELVQWLADSVDVKATSATVMRKRNGWSKGHAIVHLPPGTNLDDAILSLHDRPGPNHQRTLVARPWTGAIPRSGVPPSHAPADEAGRADGR